ncbi:MAG: efflux RND transporter periplasmic adaptor subunit [Opitutaceae bacterium]
MTERNSQLDAVEINLLLNEEKAFLPAVMVLCNELRARTGSSTVSLSIYRGHRCKLIALSNTKKFNRREPRLAALSFAMEECAEQDEEIQAPRPQDESFIVHEHSKYLKVAKEEFVLSIPIRLEGDVFAVITLERTGLAYESGDQFDLRMIADLSARRLFDLLQSSGLGIPKRIAQVRQALAWVFGVRHTWLKLGILVGIGLILFLIFFPWFYRVETSFELKASESIEMTAMVDGFIESVSVKPGAIVRKGDPLLQLNTTDFELVENETLAKIARLEADGERARAQGQLTESRLLLAEVREEEARLERIRYQLSLTTIRAAWDGFVIEGDLDEKIGSPVTKGDPLFRLSGLENLQVKLEIPENSIHELKIEGNEGELAFASRPDTKYRFFVEGIEPVGVVRPEGTVFIATATIDGEGEMWWRPGMSGVAKIDIGERPLIWVLSHRLIDFIRLKLWI